MVSFQVPHRAVENVYCRKIPTPENCIYGYLDPSIPNIPASEFEVKMSSVGEGAGRGVFTKVDIAEDSYLASEVTVHPVEFMPSTVDLIENLTEEEYAFKSKILHYYMEGYGFFSRWFVSTFVCFERMPDWLLESF